MISYIKEKYLLFPTNVMANIKMAKSLFLQDLIMTF